MQTSTSERKPLLRISNLKQYFPLKKKGLYVKANDGITLDNIYASKAMPVRKGDFQWPPKTEDCYPLIYVQENTVVNNLTIRTLHRREEKLPRATIYVGKNALVNRLILEDITTTNTTGLPMPLLDNHGTIRYLSVKDIDSDQDPALVNSGIIEVTRP